MCLLSFFNRFTESAETRMISLGFEAKSFNGLPPFHGPWQVKSLIKSVWQKSSYPNCAFLLKGWSGIAAKLLRQGFSVQPNKDEKTAENGHQAERGKMKHKLVVSIRPFSPATDPSLTTLGLVMYSVKFTVFSINKWTSQLANQLFLFMAEV